MALPKRSLWIRGLYGLAIVFMFTFLVWESWLPAYAAADMKVAVANDSADEIESQSLDSVKAKTKAKLLSTQLEGFGVIGVTTMIDLVGNVELQIDQHWQLLASSPVAEQLRQHQPVYAVYRSYDSKNNTVLLTLGVKSETAAKDRVMVVTGSYQKFEQRTVLEAWQRTSPNYPRYRYHSDFERWALDRNYQPLSVTAYMGLTDEVK